MGQAMSASSFNPPQPAGGCGPKDCTILFVTVPLAAFLLVCVLISLYMGYKERLRRRRDYAVRKQLDIELGSRGLDEPDKPRGTFDHAPGST